MKIIDQKGDGNCRYTILNIEDDMSPHIRMNLILQDDGDIILWLTQPGRRQISIEFCTPIAGGGRHPIIVKHLRAMIDELVEAGEAAEQAREVS